METISFHYAHTIYIKWVTGVKRWELWSGHNLEGNNGTRLSTEERGRGAIRDTCLGEPVWNLSIRNGESRFPNGRVSTSGHFYPFAKSCLLRNKLDQTAKAKSVIRILFPTKCTHTHTKSASVYLSLSLPTENTKQRHTPNVSGLFDPWRSHAWCCWKYWVHWREAGNAAWIIQSLASVAHFLVL